MPIFFHLDMFRNKIFSYAQMSQLSSYCHCPDSKNFTGLNSSADCLQEMTKNSNIENRRKTTFSSHSMMSSKSVTLASQEVAKTDHLVKMS
jgi:hypothetical protein